MEHTYQTKSLQGKLLITGVVTIETGMHIGGGSDYAPIGSVDSPFIRNPLTREPIIPGSSLKGKLRTLLAKINCDTYILNAVSDDVDVVKRLFGHSGKDAASSARLQFFDLFMTDESKSTFANIETDTYIGEVKFENTINRITGVANPRQIERVPAGTKFHFKLVYNVESLEEAIEDLQTLKMGLSLLESDYLGGHGSRGYGRISFDNLNIEQIGNSELDVPTYLGILKGSDQ